MKLFDGLHAFIWKDPATNNANTYFVQGSKKILLDPGHAHLFGGVRARLQSLNLSPADMDLIIITHAHPDHMDALRLFANGSTLSAFPRTEFDWLKAEASQFGASFGLSEFQPDILLQEGRLEVGDCRVEVYSTPGHSPGSVCIYWSEKRALFTGDVVFKDGVGRTDVPGGSGRELKESILRISRLDVEYLLPGHGDLISGRDAVKKNFEVIERYWFGFL